MAPLQLVCCSRCKLGGGSNPPPCRIPGACTIEIYDSNILTCPVSNPLNWNTNLKCYWTTKIHVHHYHQINLWKSKISEYQIYQFSDMPDKKISHNFTQFNTAWQIDMNKSMSLLVTKLQEQKTCYVIISAFWLFLHWHSHKTDITKFKIEILTAARDACILSSEIGLVERLMLHKRVAPVINWNLQMRRINRI
jgi:hypothetical protein